MLEQDRIIKINIEEEMKSSYIDYSMSVSYTHLWIASDRILSS